MCIFQSSLTPYEMHLWSFLAPLVGLAVANPLMELQARQLNASQSTSCSITHTRSCSNSALQSSARAFCGSLGYGTTISTIRTTATVRQTTVYTVTSTTRVATVTASVLTNTATSVRTSMTTLTSTTTDTRIATELLTVNTFGVVSACSGYTPEITAQNPEVPGANDVPTDSSTSTNTATTTTTPTGASTCSRAPWSSPSPANCGEALGAIRNAWNPNDVNDVYTLGVLVDAASTADPEGCALACYNRAGCKSFYLQSAPRKPACELYRVDTKVSNFTTGGSAFFQGFEMACFRCAAVSGTSSTTTTTRTTTPAYTTSSSISTTISTRTTTTSGVSTTTTTAALAAESYSGSGCTMAVAQAPQPSVCRKAGGVRNWSDPDGVSYDQITLFDSGSKASVEACAAACRRFDASGTVGNSGLPGCKSFYMRVDNYCRLWRGTQTEMQFYEDSTTGIINSDVACFSCSSNPLPWPAQSDRGRGQYYSCPGSNGVSLYYPENKQFQVLCGQTMGTLVGGSLNVRVDAESVEDCGGYCLADSRCTAATFVKARLSCYLKHPAESDTGQPYQFRMLADSAEQVHVVRVKYYSNDPYPYIRESEGTWIKRQATASQPACLKATNSVQITSACNCMIPSSTVTIRQTISSVLTSVRSITSTQNIVATTTTTPTQVITTTRLTVLSRTRWNTVLTTQTTTETKVSVTSWQLQATPSAFYIVDQDMAFAEWPADADEIHYHVQYDWDQSDDEYAPTIFSLDGTQLQVADLSNVEGAAEGYPVVGQAYDGPGMQIMALSNADGYAVPTCRIEATEDGKCPLRCSIDGNEVNSRNGDGLWSLLPAGSEEEFTNYVLAADVPLDGGDDDETPVDPPTPVDPGTPSTEANCATPIDTGSTSLNCPSWTYMDAYLVNGSQPLWQGTAANFTECRNKCDRNGHCRIGDYECARGICRLFDLMTDHGVIHVEGGHELMRASGCPAVASPV